MNLKRVVVTGLGAVTPIGNTVPEFWNNAIAGMSGAAPITNFDTDAIKTKIKFACEVKGFDLDRYIDRKEARKMDRYTHYSVASAVQAIEDSGLDMEKEDLERIGVIIGFGMGGAGSFVEGIETITEQAKRGQELKVTPFFVPRILGSIAA
ncbi:MAG TPA: beta-ketoacyl synthase N-terminal-like domain-containing protein, partial [Bacteroidaceae bacterium]|nr:beta-ketoacyl synthase N-terminal-like domain-containing protein [Bacteroidaceae bacterium]